MRLKVTWRGPLVAGSFLALLSVLCLVPGPALAGGVVGTGTPASCTEGALEAVLTGGGTVTFNCGFAPYVIPLTRQIVIGLDTVIDGAGLVTLSGSDSTRLFVVNAPARLTLRDLGLIDGNSGLGDGGAVLNYGTLAVEGCTFSDNEAGAAYCGGAIANLGSLAIADSTLARNQAGDGGAVCLQAGAGSLSIQNSGFVENSAINPGGGWGGALLIGDGESAQIQGGAFVRNAAETGGAIHCTPHSTLTLSGSSLQDNLGWSGGGIYGSFAEIMLTDAVVSDNWATMDGGGVFNKEGTLSANRTTFNANSAGNKGGGVYQYRGALSMTDATLSENRARVAGGGIHGWESPTNLDRLTLNDNHAGQIGGGFHVFFSPATLTNVTLSGNTSEDKGGGIGNLGGITKLVHVTLDANSAPLGGALFHDAGGWSASTLALKNTVLAHGMSGGNCFLDTGSATKIVSEGHNLSSDATCRRYLTRPGDRNRRAPKLGPLEDNGGTTLTHLPEDGSPAIDRGQCPAGVDMDQRGVKRPQFYACDIGSVEVVVDHLWQTYVPLAGRRFR